MDIPRTKCVAYLEISFRPLTTGCWTTVSLLLFVVAAVTRRLSFTDFRSFTGICDGTLPSTWAPTAAAAAVTSSSALCRQLLRAPPSAVGLVADFLRLRRPPEGDPRLVFRHFRPLVGLPLCGDEGRRGESGGLTLRRTLDVVRSSTFDRAVCGLDGGCRAGYNDPLSDRSVAELILDSGRVSFSGLRCELFVVDSRSWGGKSASEPDCCSRQNEYFKELRMV